MTIQPRVMRGKVELIVPHHDKEISFIHPSEGPNTYQEVGKAILGRGLRLPTGEETASLVYSAYNSEEPEFKEIRQIMRDGWLWVFNRNLWTDKGVYVQEDMEAKGMSEKIEVKGLEKRLDGGKEVNGIRFSKDSTLRFAPKETYNPEGNLEPDALAKDGFVIASYGKEGAEKLGEVAKKFSHKSYLWTLKDIQGPVQRVSALDEDYCGSGLGVYGNDGGYDWGGRAFGVRKTSEAGSHSRKK